MLAKRFTRALVVTATASLVMAAAVFADNTSVDGDSTQTGNQTTVALGNVCADGTGSATIPVFAVRNGNSPGPQVWADSATVTFSVTGTPTAGLAATFPDGNQVLLSPDWSEQANNTESAHKSAQIELTAGSATGPFSGTITIRGSGTGSNGGTVNRDVLVTVTATAITCGSTNAAPVADAGGPYTGVEGANVSISGAGSSDADDDPLTYKWTYSIVSADAGAACSFGDDEAASTTVTCTDDGTFTLSLEVSDGTDTDTDTASLALSNAAPAFDVGKPAFASTSVSCAARTVSVNFAFSDAGSNDTHTGTIDFGDGSGSRALTASELAVGSASFTYNSGGPYTATVTINDDDSGSTGATSTTNTLTVLLNDSGILQPINADGSSVFKLGSTIPVKIRFTDCENVSVNSLAPTVALRKLDNSTNTDVTEAPPAASADAGNVMRWSTDGEQYIFNLSTKRSQFAGGGDLTNGTYELKIYVGTQLYETVRFDIKK